jgi:hypothetical protein
MKEHGKTVSKEINNSMSRAKSNLKLNEQKEIVNFLKSISQKNYSQANKYLQSVIDQKIKSKIGNSLKEKLF